MPRVALNGDEPLTPRQFRFVQEYLIDPNATQSAIKAGYSKNGAEVTGSQLLRNPKVFAAISKRQTKIADKFEVTAERVVRELALIGYANMQDYMRVGDDGDPYLDFSLLTREQAAALVEVTVEDYKEGRGEDARDIRRVKFKLADKRAALVDLGKYIGLFKERVEHTGKDGGPIQTEDVNAVRELFHRRISGIASRVGSGNGAAKPH